MDQAIIGRDRFVAAARLRHILSAMSAVFFGSDSAWSGDAGAGEYYYHDGCGDYVRMAWDRRGLVALMYDHNSERGEFNRAARHRRPYRWLPDLPRDLADLAAGLVARNERLATAGLWVLDDDARASDPVVPAGEHGVRWFYQYALPARQAVFGDTLRQNWLYLHSLSTAQGELACRLAAADGPVELTTADDDVLLTQQDGTPADDLDRATAAAEMLAAVGVRWHVPRDRLLRAAHERRPARDAAVAAGLAERERALFEAARADRAEEVRELAAAGADLDARTVAEQWPHTPAGDTPLIQAIKAGAGAAARALIDAGADLTVANTFEQTALDWAVVQNDLVLVRLLIAGGADVNTQQTPYGWTPLHKAALQGSADIVDALLAAGADTAARLVDDRTPADCARTNHHTAIAATLAASHQTR